ncbi:MULTISPECIES: hypothetical protein [Methanocalculus]|uniref:hypothetical protein n=1 Tax=Methanocalculus TaxID=71151 RepID=UPI00209D6FDE|nr:MULTISPECIES: hypothetical protein [unclassified Methanocalculus]MCP1661725.1 hypothetical protein [Methanocalculus sp. AMF5]
MMFQRLIDDCVGSCELVTPQLLAAPFYRGRFGALVIPTGFANKDYSRVLPALRATKGRIERFLSSGGEMLVYGGGGDVPDCYDWLPFKVCYNFEYGPRKITIRREGDASRLLEGYDPDAFECDGYFTGYEGEAVAETDAGHPILIEEMIGSGRVILTTAHEYPSRAFLTDFCSLKKENFF